MLGHVVRKPADADAPRHGAVEERDFIADFYAGYFAIVNLVGMLLLRAGDVCSAALVPDVSGGRR